MEYASESRPRERKYDPQAQLATKSESELPNLERLVADNNSAACRIFNKLEEITVQLCTGGLPDDKRSEKASSGVLHLSLDTRSLLIQTERQLAQLCELLFEVEERIMKKEVESHR